MNIIKIILIVFAMLAAGFALAVTVVVSLVPLYPADGSVTVSSMFLMKIYYFIEEKSISY